MDSLTSAWGINMADLGTEGTTYARQRLELVSVGDEAGFIVSVPAPGVPAYRGQGDTDYLCASCGALLCQGVTLGLFANVVFRCGCGALIRLPPIPGVHTGRLSPFE